MSYTPQPDTLPARVCAFFERHRDEVLSAADIALKFDVGANSVGSNLADALTHKLLERFKGAGSSVWQYRAGRNIGGFRAAENKAIPAVRPSPFPTAPVAAKKKRKLPPPLPESMLEVVEADVPVPVLAKPGGARTRWATLFERLSRPGLCSCPLPVENMGAGKAAAAKYRKENGHSYTVAAINDTHFRIWRTA